jgi:xylan 1,4-beta-xylosidase
MWNRRDLLAAGAATGALGLMSQANAQTADVETIQVNVDLGKADGPLDHIWSKCAGSDRAAISLREQWRKDLERFHNEAGIERVRFHGIFADELGVYAPSLMSAKKVPNWQNVDRVYDGLIERGVKPYVELSFMPKNLASGKSTFGFYNANTTPPVSQADWGDFIAQFVQHLIGRYGASEVRTWMFEVWNEPNLPFFWTGAQADYFTLYKTTATALKGVDGQLQVGGPATSSIQWIPDFLAFCKANDAPVDFVSTHIYAADHQDKIFGKADAFPQNQVIIEGMKQVRAQIDASAFPGLKLWLSEWSSDSPAMIAHVIKGCLPYCHAMSQWAFTNTYEELGVSPYILKEGDNGFGMMAAAGIPKPQFNTYKLLNRLGQTRLAAEDGPVLATRRADGTAAVAVWNLADVPQASGIPGASWTRTVKGSPKTVQLALKGARPGQLVHVSYVDQDRGSPYPAWRKLGSPQYPTPAEIAAIRKSAELMAPQPVRLGKDGILTLDLPPECLALVETSRA